MKRTFTSRCWKCRLPNIARGTIISVLERVLGFKMSEKFMKRYDEKIKAPPFEEIDRKDPVAFKRARDRWNLERLIELEIVKIYRDRVTECHRREEVNARQNCRKVVSDYMKAFNEYKRKAWFVTEEGSWSKWKVEYN